MSRLESFHDAVRKHGSVDAALEHVFPGGSTTNAPWPSAGGLKSDMAPEYRAARSEAIAKVLQAPPELVDVDPRTLSKNQPSVTRAGVQHYLSNPQFHETGETFADQGNSGNRYPTVYRRARDQSNIILSGHHRAMAALMRGQALKARIVEGP